MVAASASSSTVTLPCVEPEVGDCPTTNYVIQLAANAHDADNEVLTYTWSVTGGKISGEGGNVTWDLTGSQPGSYVATVQVSDGTNSPVSSSATVTIAKCAACHIPPCPAVSVSCPSDVEVRTITFTASVGAGGVTYNWSVSAGTITSGQGTSTITVDTAGLGGQTVTATAKSVVSAALHQDSVLLDWQ